MNKRGDLPVTILVIGVFALCSLALLSFFYSSYNLNESFVGMSVMENANIKIEEGSLEYYSFSEKRTKISPEWGLEWKKEKILFLVEFNI